MTTKTKQLGVLIRHALQKNFLVPVTAKELLVALKDTEEELETIYLYETNCRQVKESLQQALQSLSVLMFALQNKTASHLNRNKYLLNRAETLYKKIVQALKWYCYVPEYDQQQLLPVKKLSAQLSAIGKTLQEDEEIQEIYSVLQPEIAAMMATKKLPCHRWIWWSKCCAAITHTSSTNSECLEHILAALNYNSPAFIRLLTNKMEQGITNQHSLPQKLAYIMGELVHYHLLHGAGEGFIPAERSVKQTMISVLKKKHRLLQNMSALPAGNTRLQTGKLHTVLSVPQLAVFIRLLVETKVINETNNLSLLRSVAAVISTEKATILSPGSLKINYYTPGNPAKTIVKDYLLNMMNILRRY